MRGLMTGMGSLKHEMDRVFDRFLEGRWDEIPGLGEWTPNMDISETKDSLVAKVEVPGMDPKDIQISLQENLLTIKGEKRQEKEEKDEHYHRVERAYGVFTRSVRLPRGSGREQGDGELQERAADRNAAKDAISQGDHDTSQGRTVE